MGRSTLSWEQKSAEDSGMRTMTAAEMETTDRRVELLVDEHVAEVTTLPKGRKGLWGALAFTATPGMASRALPSTDSALLGARSESMFDYDPAMAVRLAPA